MAEDFTFYTQAMTKLDAGLTSYISSTATSVIGAIGPVSGQLLILYVILYGWMMMRGMVDEPVTDFVTRMVRLAVIVGLALNMGYYNGYIVNFIWNTPEAFAAYVTGGGYVGSSNINFLDQLMTDFYNLGDKFWAYSSGMTSVDLGPKLVALLVWVAGTALTAYAAFLLILAKVALAILLGIGPVFVLLLMFEGTKRFFESWLGQALNYVMMIVLTSAAVKLILTLIQKAIPNATEIAGETGSISAALPPIALGVIGVLVLMQLASVASALGGGAAISTLGAGAALWSKTKGAAGGAKNMATGKTLSDMRGARRQKETNAKWAERSPGKTARLSSAAYEKITSSRTNRVSRG